MAALYFPEALNQGHATILEILRGSALILCISLLFGFIGYAATVSVLGVYATFAKRLPFWVMHKASMAVGLAFAAIVPLYMIPFFLYPPSSLAAILGICLGLMALAFAIRLSVRIVRRSPSQAHEAR